jgi:hypothetical protein
MISNIQSFRNIPSKLNLINKQIHQNFQRLDSKIELNALSASRCDKFVEFLEKNKRWGGKFMGPLIRYINILFIGSIFSIVLRVLNKFKSHRANVLLNNIWKRLKGQGLLTVSNHQSFYDDPGLWAALLPWWRIRPEVLRWSLCTEDVFFAVSHLKFVMIFYCNFYLTHSIR